MKTDLHDLADALSRGDAGDISAALGLPGAPTLADKLRALIREGLTHAAAVYVFGEDQAASEPGLSAYIDRARATGTDELEFDPAPFVSPGGDPGAWVTAWVWVSDERAGVDDVDYSDGDGAPVCVWYSDAAGGWRWDTGEDSGGFDRIGPRGPFGSKGDAQQDAADTFGVVVFFDGMPDHYDGDPPAKSGGAADA